MAACLPPLITTVDGNFVSRKQATLRLASNGASLDLTSQSATNATGVRRRDGATWTWLSQSESCQLSEGDAIALARGASTSDGPPASLILLVCNPLEAETPSDPELDDREEPELEAADDQKRFWEGGVYLNLLPGEAASPRHLSWAELVPAGCQLALFTSLFPERSYTWLRGVSPMIPRALLIADRIPKPEGHPPPTLRAPDDDGWLVLEGQRSAGIVHCSLILFRTPTFLRFICGGTNLEGQYELDRDSLFVQDFPQAASSKPADSAMFGARLCEFLQYLPYTGLAGASLHRVRAICAEMLHEIDFRTANGALITCMPGGPASLDKGGWSMLRRSLRQMNAPRCSPGRVDIATGHFGAIYPPFLAMMTTVLRNGDQAADEWSAIDNGRLFLYHSSRATVLARRTNSFAVLRTTAPGNRAGAATDATLLDQYFHDALPRFERAHNAPEDTLTPILHGKALLATADGGGGAIMFVGSQNFSKASWGEGREQMTNVELGVVTVARTPEAVAELRARFPVQLASDAAYRIPAARRGYIMARGPTDGDHSMQGLQMRWRVQCTDLNLLPAWRLFLHRWWRMCSNCLAPDVPCTLSAKTRVAEIERLARNGTPFLCGVCKSQHQPSSPPPPQQQLQAAAASSSPLASTSSAAGGGAAMSSAGKRNRHNVEEAPANYCQRSLI